MTKPATKVTNAYKKEPDKSAIRQQPNRSNQINGEALMSSIKKDMTRII